MSSVCDMKQEARKEGLGRYLLEFRELSQGVNDQWQDKQRARRLAGHICIQICAQLHTQPGCVSKHAHKLLSNLPTKRSGASMSWRLKAEHQRVAKPGSCKWPSLWKGMRAGRVEGRAEGM